MISFSSDFPSLVSFDFIQTKRFCCSAHKKGLIQLTTAVGASTGNKFDVDPETIDFRGYHLGNIFFVVTFT